MIRFYLKDVVFHKEIKNLILLRVSFFVFCIATPLIGVPVTLATLKKVFMCENAGFFTTTQMVCSKNFNLERIFEIWNGTRSFVSLGGINSEMVDKFLNIFSTAFSGNIAYLIFALIFVTHLIVYISFIEARSDASHLIEMERAGFRDKDGVASGIVKGSIELLLWLPGTLGLYAFLIVYLQPIEFNSWTLLLTFGLHFFIALILLMAPFFGPTVFKRQFSRISFEAVENEVHKQIVNQKSILELEESLFLEFKASFQSSYPHAPQKHSDDKGQTFYTIGGKQRFRSEKEIQRLLQDMVLEAIVGFLNASGGKLVIGVHEKDNIKNIVGIEYERFSSEDEYERHVIQHIINRIGMPFMGDYITTGFEEIDGRKLFIIDIKAFVPRDGQIPALLDGVSCFRRTGPRTDEILPGADFAKFVADRMRRK